MPVSAKRIGGAIVREVEGTWRVVEEGSWAPVKDKNGKRVDGGGFADANAALAKAQEINKLRGLPPDYGSRVPLNERAQCP